MISNTINDDVTMRGGAQGTLLAGRFRVVKQLGQGGMGSVWLAEDTLLDNKQFAIKMLPSILVSNKRAYRQLKDEALVAMKLTHPNIVTLRAFEENNGNPFLVMDYIDGETLDDYLADFDSRVEHVERVEVGDGRAASPRPPQSGLPEFDVIRLLKPIAAALDYAHTKGVVHRDVKPGNVMIARDGTPYILDFGIAREIQETMTRVTGKLSSGTLLYMSPEQLNGDAPKKEQDVYSFAAMAYECLKGEPPFARGAIEDQIRNKQPEPLTANGGAPLTGGAAILAAGVMAGLAKKPEARPPTCAAVLSGDVSRVERADAAGRGTPTAPQGRSRSAATVKVLAAAALLGTIAAWLVMRRDHVTIEPPEADNVAVTNEYPIAVANDGFPKEEKHNEEAKQGAVEEYAKALNEADATPEQQAPSVGEDETAANNDEADGQDVEAQSLDVAEVERAAGGLTERSAVERKADADRIAIEAAKQEAARLRQELDNLHREQEEKEKALQKEKAEREAAERMAAQERAAREKAAEEERKKAQKTLPDGPKPPPNEKRSLTIKAVLNGEPVYGARMKTMLGEVSLPHDWDEDKDGALKKGRPFGPYDVSYSENGIDYEGKFEFEVNWDSGHKDVKVELCRARLGEPKVRGRPKGIGSLLLN